MRGEGACVEDVMDAGDWVCVCEAEPACVSGTVLGTGCVLLLLLCDPTLPLAVGAAVVGSRLGEWEGAGVLEGDLVLLGLYTEWGRKEGNRVVDLGK